MNKPPRVSVCIGTYNRERYIRECLESVFAQTEQNFEVIVVDDASTDGTLDILRSYGSRIRLVERKNNSGLPAVPRNEAMRMAQGEFIALLDSDDSWYPSKLRDQLNFMEKNPSVPLCHTYCHVLDEESKVLGVRHENRLPATGDCFEALLKHCFISISSVLIRRSLIDRIGYFNESRFYRAREDYEFFLRVARDFPVGLVPDVCSCYRRSSQGISHQDSRWMCMPEDVPVHDMILHRRDLWARRVGRAYVVGVLVDACVANAVYWRNRHRSARAGYFALRALRRNPLNRAAWLEGGKSVFTLFVRRP